MIATWKARHMAFCGHWRRCTDCTADRLCVLGQSLWEMADEAGEMPCYSAAPEGDYTPMWLSLLTLTFVVLLAFGLGLLWGTGGIF